MSFLEAIYETLMYFTGWPLACVLLLGGIYFTIRTKFVQCRLLGETLRVLTEKPEKEGAVSSFGALMISTASRVGTGNIIGVSSAICVGGPGAVFWMWLCAFIGGASAFVESTLAQIYKRKNPDGTSYGGPAYYIESVLKTRTLAVIFATALIFTYGVGYNMLASYNLQSAFAGFSFYKTGSSCWIIGGSIAMLFLLCVLGGGKWIVKTTGTLVPFMGVCYILLALIALGINFRYIPTMFEVIFQSAFDFKAIFGGFAGSVIMLGMKRGLYSNEAGIGSAPNAAAAADVSHPVKQGLVQMLSVFIDTLLVCSATAFMCLSSGVTPEKDLNGAPFVQEAMTATFGQTGPVFIAVAMLFFAFTTLLGNFYYVESCLAYIMKKTPDHTTVMIVRIAGAYLIFLGAGMQIDLAWNTADIAQCILAFINIPVCIILGGIAFRALNDYMMQRRAGKNPVFKAADIQLKEKTDFWN